METTIKWMKPRIKSTIWNIRKQKQPIRTRRKSIQNNEGNIRSIWDFKRSNIRVTGVLEGGEKEKEIGNLFEKIMKENVPNLVEEIDIRVQEAQRVPNKLDPKRNTPGRIIIKIWPKVKIKREF